MTDKEQFDQIKKENLDRKIKLKKLAIMKSDVNRKLLFLNINEEDKTVLLSELQAIDINIFKLKRNKYNSKAYEFKEGPLYNRRDRRSL